MEQKKGRPLMTRHTGWSIQNTDVPFQKERETDKLGQIEGLHSDEVYRDPNAE